MAEAFWKVEILHNLAACGAQQLGRYVNGLRKHAPREATTASSVSLEESLKDEAGRAGHLDAITA